MTTRSVRGMIGKLTHALSDEDAFLFAAGDKITVLEFTEDFYARHGWDTDGDMDFPAEPVERGRVLCYVHIDGGIYCWFHPDKVTITRGWDILATLGFYDEANAETIASVPDPFAPEGE